MDWGFIQGLALFDPNGLTSNIKNFRSINENYI